MKEHPILMSGALVRATLADLKTQTRRLLPKVFNSPPDLVIEALPLETKWRGFDAMFAKPGCWGIRFAGQPAIAQRCPFGVVGDRLWVRETWRSAGWRPEWDWLIQYAAGPGNGEWRTAPEETLSVDVERGQRWRPSIHMPRRAARLTLEVTSIRVERLQDISEEDIAAEGCTMDKVAAWTGVPWSDMPTLHHAWRAAWNHINGERCPYASNPWVWVIGFRKVTP